MTSGALQPRIGIVIPCYKQPLLADEALASVYEQAGCAAPVVAAVNDGCPMAETEEGLRAWVQAFGGRLHVLRRWNGGLSAARNTGARFLLARYPSLEALFFLDADNLLENGALTVFERLLDTRPGPDWFYPQFDMFGLRYNATNCGRYSLLLHTHDNMCEAGSLVRRRVFEAGVFFDESMRLGYEDWDFWLSAARHGFRGEPIEEPVFLYRKRPESMLSGSHRYDAELRSFLRRKHAWLYNPKTVLTLEEAEAPRYRFLFDDGSIVAATDPLGPGRSMTAEKFAREVWAWIASEGETGAGSIWVAANRAAWDALKEQGLLRFAVWDLERRLEGFNASTLVLEVGPDNGFALTPVEQVEDTRQQAALVGMETNVIEQAIRDPSDHWLETFGDNNTAHTLAHRRLILPKITSYAVERGGAMKFLTSTIVRLKRSPLRPLSVQRHSWRTRVSPPVSRLHRVARDAASCGPLYPRTNIEDPQSVCFLVTIADFGGVETVTANVAGVLRHQGFRTALCMIGTNPIRISPDLRTAFDEMLWFPEPSAHWWSDTRYLGTNLPQSLSSQHEKDLLGLLSSFSFVIGCHSGGGATVLRSLQRTGVVTGLYEHVTEVGDYGRTYGCPFIALAYEAGVDFLCTCSAALGDWMIAHGYPPSKTIVVPNGPGFAITDQERQELHRRRQTRAPHAPLHALFLGRLDRQKGIDRLARIIRRLKEEKINILWRVVGKPIVDTIAHEIASLGELVTIEAPVYTTSERLALFNWADVIVLPSRYEGLPLTIIEAQQCGVVPITTETGAVSEVVKNGVNGILVDQSNVEDQIVAFLKSAAENPKLLLSLQSNMLDQEFSWFTRTTHLLNYLSSLPKHKHPSTRSSTK